MIYKRCGISLLPWRTTGGVATCVFTEKDGQTEIEFTEDVTAKKLIMKPFVKGFLKKQQEQYVSDLRNALL